MADTHQQAKVEASITTVIGKHLNLNLNVNVNLSLKTIAAMILKVKMKLKYTKSIVDTKSANPKKVKNVKKAKKANVQMNLMACARDVNPLLVQNDAELIDANPHLLLLNLSATAAQITKNALTALKRPLTIWMRLFSLLQSTSLMNVAAISSLESKEISHASAPKMKIVIV